MSLPFSRHRPAILPGAVLVALLLGAGAPSLDAQVESLSLRPSTVLPRVFLDCHAPRSACDFDHFRSEIISVNWVVAPEAADVHVILTSTMSGGGGRQYAFDFLGRNGFSGLEDELTYTSTGTDVQRELIDGLTQTLRLGLLRFSVQAGFGRDFEIVYDPRVPPAVEGEDAEDTDLALEREDPWDFWTFRLQVSGNLRIEERRSERRFNPQISANRTTEDWKLNFSVWSNFRRDRVELADGREVTNDQDLWRTSALVVRSVSGHISVGFDGGARNSIQNNQRARVQLAPAVEWNYYPYMEATRRQLIAHYQVGVEYSSYELETIFGETEETLPHHRFAVQYNAREAWGDAGVGIETRQYLHDRSLYNFGVTAQLNYRVLRGLELSLSGDVALVNDQIHIPQEDIPDEEILLGRRNLPTGYDYRASIGLSYRWGSIFTNVVNTRFPSSVR